MVPDMRFEIRLTISAIISLYSMFLLKLYLDTFLSEIKEKRAAVGWLLFFFWQMYMNMEASRHLWSNHLLITLVTVAVVGLFGYTAALWKRYTFSMMFVALWGLVEMLVLLGFEILRGKVGNSSYIIGVLLPSKAVMFPLVMGIKFYMNKKGGAKETYKEDIFLIFPLVASMTVYYSFYMTIEQTSTENIGLLRWLLLGTAALIVLHLFVYPFYVYMLEQTSLKKSERFYIKQLELFEEQKKLKEEEAVAFHTSRHDLKQKLIYIHELAKHEEKEKMMTVLSEMIGETGKEKMEGRTGNIVVDALVNHLYLEAKSKGIQLNTKIKLPRKLDIEDTDLCVLQGNAFDNALEALEYVAKEDREMWLEMKYERGSLLLLMKNPYKGELVQEDDGLYKSRKKEGIHGLGLRSMKKVVNKYNGMMVTEGKDGFFTLKVILFER